MDLLRSKPGPASVKKKRRNAFVDTEDDSDAASDDERDRIRVRKRWGKKVDTTGSLLPSNANISAVRGNQHTLLPVEEVNFPEQVPSMVAYNSQTGNVGRIDNTYSLLMTSPPQGLTDKGIRLKSSRDLLEQPTINEQTRDRINELSNQFQLKGHMLDMAHLKVVMGQIQYTLESMSREELISFCKMKIEEEITGKAERIERDKQFSQLEASLLASKAELTVLQTKNSELKYAVTSIYGEYKKKTSQAKTPPSVFKDLMYKLPDKPPIVPVQINRHRHPLGFILPDNPPQDNSEFITGDIKTEFPEVPILPMNSDTAPEILRNVTKQEDLACTQNCVPLPNVNPTHYLVITPPNCHSPFPSPLPPPALPAPPAPVHQNSHQQQQSSSTPPIKQYNNPCKERTPIQNDSLDIEDRIPHALIKCKSVQNFPSAVEGTQNDVHVSNPQPPSSNVEVFKVLQSIDLTRKQTISKQKTLRKTPSDDMNNCFPRIVSTQSLAPQAKVGSVSAKPPDNLTANSLVSNAISSVSNAISPVSNANLSVSNANSSVSNNTEIPTSPASSQMLLPGSCSSDLLNSNGQTILNGANPMQIAYIVNGAPGSQGPQQMYFTFQPQTLQGSSILYPQSNGPVFFSQPTYSVTSETGPMMIPRISGVTSLGKSVHGATNSVGTQVLQEVFDLTDDVPVIAPKNKSGDAPRLVYRFKTSTKQWKGNLDNKLLEVRKTIYLNNLVPSSNGSPERLPHIRGNQQLNKIAMVKISPEEKMAADSKIESGEIISGTRAEDTALRNTGYRAMEGVGNKKVIFVKRLSKFSGSAPSTLVKKFA